MAQGFCTSQEKKETWTKVVSMEIKAVVTLGHVQQIKLKGLGNGLGDFKDNPCAPLYESELNGWWCHLMTSESWPGFLSKIIT